MAKRLTFGVTNNMSKYEACAFGLTTLIALRAKNVEVFGDSMLVIRQMQGEWELKEERLKPYLFYLRSLVQTIPDCKFQHLPREENQMADALATLAATWENPEKLVMRPLVLTTASKPVYEIGRILEVEVDDGKPWYYDVQRYLENAELPEEARKKDRIIIQKLASQYVSLKGEIYKRQGNGIQLKCLRKEEAHKIMEEVHAGVCGPHMNGLNLSRKIVRQGFLLVNHRSRLREAGKTLS